MVFNSLSFILFLAILLILNRLPIRWAGRKTILLVASYLFYAAWNPPFVILLWISTIADWYIAKGLGTTNEKNKRRLLLFASLAVNLGLLAFFKYGGFLTTNFVAMMQTMGVDWQIAKPNIILPVGISFYTFQTLSYSLDVYRKKAQPADSFLDYALYVTFFPQLVAGPIVRATDFLPQCKEPKRGNASQLSWGLSLLVLGLFNKMVIADHLLAPIVERVYDGTGEPGFVDAWLGTFAFSGQIFCDFAGYSTCAIGVAMCLGFALPDNFRFPYAAIGFSDFWRRWHISLSTWLRDYLYIPLGGNRKGKFNTWRNLFLTMLLGGLWHGAAWTFVVWGALHGGYLAFERILQMTIPASAFWKSHLGKALLMIGTYLLICVSWVFFRANSFQRSFSTLASMVGRTPDQQGYMLTPLQMGIVITITIAMLAIHWSLRSTSVEALADRSPRWLRAIVLGIMLFMLMIVPGEDRAFIYFQF
jgi:alginate O-acetyltransferase complex protein AlgI